MILKVMVSRHLKSIAILTGFVALILSFSQTAGAEGPRVGTNSTARSMVTTKEQPIAGTSRLVSQAITPSYIPWYTSSPAPIPSAYAAIGKAFGAGYLYNTLQMFRPSGNAMLDTGLCSFICYGAPGVSSHHYITYGNDVDPGSPGTSLTHNGAANDCNRTVFPPSTLCPGGVTNQDFGVTVNLSRTPHSDGYYLAVDSNGNFGLLGALYVGHAVIAGGGTGTPAPWPSPTTGSLVSDTGASAGSGDFLLGSITGYVKCDYGETSTGTLTCSQPFTVSNGTSNAGINASAAVWADGGVQPNGTSGGYAPEAFPVGVATTDPQILSGSCTIVGSGTCTFPNSFSFGDTTYNCAISAQGNVPKNGSYVKSSATAIMVYTGSGVGSSTFSYICMR